MQDWISLSPHPASAAAARQFVAGALWRESPDDDFTETATLLTSELVTNVILHASSDMIMEIDHDEQRLRVTVFDGSDKPSLLRETRAPLEEHGRGLQVVDALATSWGVNEGSRGKTVWFELATSNR